MCTNVHTRPVLVLCFLLARKSLIKSSWPGIQFPYVSWLISIASPDILRESLWMCCYTCSSPNISYITQLYIFVNLLVYYLFPAESFQDIPLSQPGILPRTLLLPQARERKNLWRVMRKSFHYQQWVFSRIRNKRFQGYPGILLPFLTV